MLPADGVRSALGAALGGAQRGLAAADQLCHACVDLLDVDGAAISVMDRGATIGTFGSSSGLSRRLDEFQFTYGEGPCMDAVTSSRPILIADFHDRGAAARWPAYSGAVLDEGVRAVYALPVSVSSVTIGALDLFRNAPGPLSDAALAGGLMAARLATLPLLDLIFADVDWAAVSDGNAWEQLASLERVEVYQATGMIMAALDVGPTAALARLRAHAYAHGMTASETAWQIVARHLVLQRDDPRRRPEGKEPGER